MNDEELNAKSEKQLELKMLEYTANAVKSAETVGVTLRFLEHHIQNSGGNVSQGVEDYLVGMGIVAYKIKDGKLKNKGADSKAFQITQRIDAIIDLLTNLKKSVKGSFVFKKDGYE